MMIEWSLMDYIDHLLDESFPSGFAFSGVLLCCVSSVVMKIDYQYCYKLDTHISIYMQINGLPDLNQHQ